MARKNQIKSPVNFDKVADSIRISTIKEFMNDNYLPYAHYVIQDRALVGPDGLKPVQRRGLWTLWVMGLKHNGGTKKANTVYGRTIGDYHPHGPASVSGAISKLGQWYTARVRLIEVEGSVGTEMGDKPAADRYYEIKLSEAGEHLLEDVKNKAAFMIPNYSNEAGKEIPSQLPVKWPFDIINGGQGIAVGYATNMMPHNPTEVMNAVIERMKGNLNTTKKLLSIMKGPDFPTGGVLLGNDGIKDYYETGEGKFIIRGDYTIESLPRGRHAIKFSSLPYQISPEKVQQNITKAWAKNKLTDITEYKNLTDMDSGVNFVLYVKAGANPQLVLQELFKETSLETRFSVNNTKLLDGVPKKASMFELLDSFIEFRKECFLRKTNHRVSAIKIDLIKATGLAKVLLDVDKAISIIRKSDDDEIAKEKLMKHFKIDEISAKSILEMRLQQLTKKDKNSLQLRIKNLEEELKKLEIILNNEDEQLKAMIAELQQTKKVIGDERLTKISDTSTSELEEAEKQAKKTEKLLNKDVECKIIFNPKTNTISKSLIEDNKPLAKNEFISTTQGKIQALQYNGKFIEINVDSILLDQETNLSVVGINEDKTKLILPDLTQEDKILVVTNFGNVNIFKNVKYDNFVKLIVGEEIIYAKVLKEKDFNNDILVFAKDGMLARFPVSQIRESNSGSGLIAGMKVNDLVVSAKVIEDTDKIIITQGSNTLKSTELESVPSTNRNVKGSLLHKPAKGETMELMEVINTEEKLFDDNDKEVKIPKITDRARTGSKNLPKIKYKK